MDFFRDDAIRDGTIIMQMILSDSDIYLTKNRALQWIHDYGTGEGHSPAYECIRVTQELDPVFATVCTTCGKLL